MSQETTRRDLIEAGAAVFGRGRPDLRGRPGDSRAPALAGAVGGGEHVIDAVVVDVGEAPA